MKTTSTFRSLSVLFVLLSSYTSFCQIYSDEEDYVIPETEYFFEGKIVLNNNTITTGHISLNHSKQDEYFTAVDNGNNINYISNNDIASVVLFADDKRSSIESRFEKIDETGKFHRVLGVGEITIYDDSVKPFSGNLVSPIIVKENGILKSIFDFWSSGPKKDLINFINQRDGKNFNGRDFKSNEQLIAYACSLQ